MSDDIHRVTCATENCGTFVMDVALYRKLQRTGETFHCPEGHPQHFTESTEQQLRDRIEELERKAQRYKKRAERHSDTLRDLWADRREERRHRKRIQQALLPAINGVVEVDDECWLWGCACGGAARSTFETKTRAEQGLRQHRSQSCDGGVADRIEAIQAAGERVIGGHD